MLLNKQECDELSLFVRSPYHNKQEVLITLLDYFLKYYPDYSHEGFGEEASWSFLYPGTNIDKNRLAQLMTKLYKLIDQFIFINSVSQKTMLPWLIKGEYFFDKKSFHFFEKNYKDFTKGFNKRSPKTTDDYQMYYQVVLDHHNQIMASGQKSPIYDQLHHALDQKFIIDKLSLGAISMLRKYTAKEEISTPFVQEAFDYAEKNLAQLPPLANLWFLAFTLLNQPQSEDSYHDLKRFWLMHHPEFSSNTNNVIASILETIVRRVFLNKRKIYMEELFSIYLMQIQQGWLIQENLLQAVSFNNIVFVSIYLKKSDWAKKFVEDHKKYLIPEIKPAVHTYNLARIDFAIGDFSNCLKKIAQIELIDTKMTVGAKRIQLKAYYELDEHELMEAGINSLRVYLHRLKDLSDFFKDYHHLFTNVLNHLFKIKVGDKGIETLIKVKEEVDVQRSIPEYDWIVEKIEELEKG